MARGHHNNEDDATLCILKTAKAKITLRTKLHSTNVAEWQKTTEFVHLDWVHSAQ